jgi:hypothetical protein
MLEIDVSRGEKVILPVENCTGGALSGGNFGQDYKILRMNKIIL